MAATLSSFSDLPFEDVIAVSIFPHLKLLEIWKLRTLCKSLYLAVNHYIKYLTRTIHVSSLVWSDFYPALSKIITGSRRLQCLSIESTDSSQFNNFAIERCLNSLTTSVDLCELKLHGISIQKEKTLHCLSNVTLNLKVLHILYVKGLSDGLDVILKNTTSLQEFVCFGTDISRTFVTSITDKQNNISVLKLSDCLKELKSNEFLAITKLHELHTLKLEFINCITDRIIQTITEFCPKLRSLELQNCLQLSWNALEYLQRKNILIQSSSQLPQFKIYNEQI